MVEKRKRSLRKRRLMERVINELHIGGLIEPAGPKGCRVTAKGMSEIDLLIGTYPSRRRLTQMLVMGTILGLQKYDEEEEHDDTE